MSELAEKSHELTAEKQAESQRTSTETVAPQASVLHAKKPWYKDAPNLISGFALLVSVFAIIQTQSEHRNHELESLEQIAVDIVENQKALSELPANQTDAVLSSNIQSFLVQKGNTLASRGIELAEKDDGQATSEILFAIGYQAAFGGRYREAENLFKRAIEKSDSALAKSGPQLALARLCFIESPPACSIEKGESLYKDALDGMGKPSNPALVYQTGYLYETWAEAEFKTGRMETSVYRLASAEALYKSLPLWDGNRQLALLRIEQTRSKEAQTSAAGQTISQKLAGKWTVVDKPEDYASTTLTISSDPTSGLLSGSLIQPNLFKGLAPKLEEHGPIVLGNQGSALFRWQGTDPLVGPIKGETILTFDKEITHISAVEERSGQSSVKYTFRRCEQSPRVQ